MFAFSIPTFWLELGRDKITICQQKARQSPFPAGWEALILLTADPTSSRGPIHTLTKVISPSLAELDNLTSYSLNC